MKSIIKFSLLALTFLAFHSFASAAEWVATTRIENNGVDEIKLYGETSSSTPPGTTVTVYFEYGVNYNNLSSSTPPQELASLQLNTAKNSVFSATVTDTLPNVYNYFQAVRKTVTASPSATTYERSGIYQIVPYPKNDEPEIVAVVPFNGSACEDDDCEVTIPEDFSRLMPVATVYTRDPNSNQSLYLDIVSGNTNNAFAFNYQGELKVTSLSAIDYERTRSFDLVIKVVDNGFPQKSDTVDLKINIRNIENEDGDESTYGNNDRNATYVEYGNVGGENLVRYAPRYTGPSFNTDYSNVNSNVRYTGSTGGGSTYNTGTGNINVGATYTGGTSGGSTYQTGNQQNYYNNPTQNPFGPPIYQNEAARQALIEQIRAQIAALQAELAERVRLGLP